MNKAQIKTHTLSAFFSALPDSRGNSTGEFCANPFLGLPADRLKVVPLSALVNKCLPRQRVQILPPQPIHKKTALRGGFFMNNGQEKTRSSCNSCLRGIRNWALLVYFPILRYSVKTGNAPSAFFSARPNCRQNAKFTCHAISSLGLYSLSLNCPGAHKREYRNAPTG